MDKLSYALGIGIGSQLAGMGAKELNIDDFAQAIKDVISGSQLKVDNVEAQTLVQNFFQEQEAKQQAAAAEAGKAAKAEGEAFLAENGKKEGIVTLPSGLQYQVLKEGNGKKPSATDQVVCHYEGTLIDGTVFDSSYQRNQPATFGLIRLSLVGPRVYSLCRKVLSIASLSLISLHTVSVVQVHRYLLLLHSYSM